jgi:prepilin-type N-terminal cleavage/methylation domain-containing protein
VYHVSIFWRLSLTCQTMDPRQKRQAGLTLTELLCVIAILLILAGLYLPAIARAYKRIVTFLGDF